MAPTDMSWNCLRPRVSGWTCGEGHWFRPFGFDPTAYAVVSALWVSPSRFRPNGFSPVVSTQRFRPSGPAYIPRLQEPMGGTA